MQDMKKKANSGEPLKQKERHIVTWSQEEDDILREQIQTHGIDNWAIIASKFKDKTTRQCRRRWFTYLNSDFKKGGWSPEEDMLLCEAQKIFGNRWTEIAKVVSGRTDNAVKNRFTTLCKKRAKHEALAKENTASYINTNNKRITLHSGRTMDEIAVPPMKMRKHIPDATEDSNLEGGLLGDSRTMERPPFAVLMQNLHSINDFSNQLRANINEPPKDANSNMVQGSFLKKDDPKIIALMQQAELLSSLAIKVNTEKTEQSLENAWKVVQDFLKHTKESDMVRFKIDDMDFQLETFKDLVEDLRSSNEGSQQSWRQPDLYAESPESSEYSTGSTILPQIIGDKMEHAESGLHEVENQPVQVVEPNNLVDDQEVIIPDATRSQELLSPENIATSDILPPSEEFDKDIGALCALPDIFSSPLQVTPLFRSLTAGIPSPQFSESERNFLLKTLGMESTPTNPSTRTSQPPPCKRALLHCL